MKILVFSDSHGVCGGMLKALEAHRGTTDAVIYLGDGLADARYAAERFSETPFCFIAGNCDEADTPHRERPSLCYETLLDFNGVQIFATHGHRYGVKNNMLRFAEYAYNRGADIALFGHTHQCVDSVTPLETGAGRMRVFNPGSCKSSYTGTYGVLHLTGGVIVTGFGHIN